MDERHQNWLLSGGIGSGKSVVRGFLESHGVTTIDADSVGHEVLADNETAAEVAAVWPSVVEDGMVDRSRLGEIVFSDSHALSRLEAITHPRIFGRIRDLVAKSDGPVVVELPLLIQPFARKWPRMVVDSRDETRLHRAVARGLSEQRVLERMSSQPTRGQWLAEADLVIPNEGTVQDLEVAVSELMPTQGAAFSRLRN